MNASAQAAQSAGVDLSVYDHVVRYTPPNASGCAGGGQGDQPGRNSIIFGVGINSFWDYSGHEVGHNFGCGHASSYDNCPLGGFAGSCTHNEYGDQTDIMGGRNGQYMSYYKDGLGWLDEANKIVVTASRQVRLYPIETASTGLQSVLIPRGDNTQFHLEFRRPVGYDSFLETNLTNGALLRYLPAGNGGLPHIIDFGSSSGARDAALRPGTAFTDANRQIRVVEATAESVLVDIVIDGIPPGGAGGMPGMGGAGGMPGGAGRGNGGSGGVAGTGSGGAGAAGMPSGGSAGAGGSGAGSGGAAAGSAGASSGGASGGGGSVQAGASGVGGVPATGGSVGAAGSETGSGGAAGAGVSGSPGLAGASTAGTATNAPATDGAEEAGCGCRLSASKRQRNAWTLLGLPALAALALRRRQRSHFKRSS